MARSSDPTGTSPTLRPLTKREIDDRMARLGNELALASGRCPRTDAQDGLLRPTWIEPADLVRRVSRFLVNN